MSHEVFEEKCRVAATLLGLGNILAFGPKNVEPLASPGSAMSRRIQTVPFAVVSLMILCALLSSTSAEDAGWVEERRATMAKVIQSYATSLPDVAGVNGISAAVLDVMRTVPRHRFVPEPRKRQAYDDAPLPIGYGQTISQPFIVALMTHLLEVDAEAIVLEIGTGSGYQAAVLSSLTRKVCTIEIIPGLGDTATRRLKELGYGNIETKIGDGYLGWPECGPFDAIIVTAAAGHIPPPLVKQLKPGGRMVIPVGSVFGPQYLTLIEKTTGSGVRARQVLPVRFVPLTRGSE